MFRSVISCLLLLTVLCVNVHNSTLSAQSDQSSQEMKRSFSIIRSYESDGQFERAIEEGEKLLVECEKNYPELSPRLYDILSHAYSSMTDFDSAIEYADKAIEKAKLYSDYSFEDILLLKQNKLSSLTNNYDFEAAMPLVAEIELAIKNNELPRDSYFYAYAQLSSTYGQFGMLEQSYNFFQLAESYSDQIPVNTKIYFLLDMSSDAPNNFVRKSCIDKAWNLYQTLQTKDDNLLVHLYRFHGDYYSGVRDYQKAMESYVKALNIYEETGNFDMFSLTLMENAAEVLRTIGNYDESIVLNEKVVEIRRNIYGNVNHPLYWNSLHQLFYDYIYARQFPKADTVYKELGRITKNRNDKESRMLFLYNGADLASAKGEYKKADNLYQKCWEYFKDSGKLDYYQRSLLYKMVDMYARSNSDKYRIWSAKKYDVYKEEILNDFIGLNDAERSNWIYYIEELSSHMIRYCNLGDKALAAESSLFFKGLLYKTGSVIRSMVESNPEAQELYVKLKEQKNWLNALMNTGDSVRIAALRNEIGELERKLNNDFVEFKQFRKEMDVSWTEVKNGLSDKQLLIDFVSYEDSTGVWYRAFVYSKKTNEPIYVELFNEKELSAFIQHRPEEVYQSADFYQLVWSKLLPFTDGYTDVYFSPVGLLHKVAIENHSMMMEYQRTNQVRFHRVPVLTDLNCSSGLKLNHVVAFGDIDYSQQLQDNLYSATNLRGNHWGGLPGTAREMEIVGNCLSGKPDSDVAIYTKDKATERQFMDYDGKEVNLFHFATHGFYYDDLDRKSNHEYMRRMSRLYDSFSGLLMSGANRGWENSEIGVNLDDGILTYDEIANCKFKDLEVVVLSACDTGLGDVNYDGVWGLQRAFKLAGATNLIVSLCKIDDSAAEQFMTHFYEGVAAGNSVYQAFDSARDQMKQAYPDEPLFWSSFILVE